MCLQYSPFAALRELFRTKAGNYSSDPIVMTKDIGLPSVKKDIKTEVTEENSKIEDLLALKDEVDNEPSSRTSLMGLNDSDEFFDVPESTDYNNFENEWHSESVSEQPVFLLTSSFHWFDLDSEFPSICILCFSALIILYKFGLVQNSGVIKNLSRHINV